MFVEGTFGRTVWLMTLRTNFHKGIGRVLARLFCRKRKCESAAYGTLWRHFVAVQLFLLVLLMGFLI